MNLFAAFIRKLGFFTQYWISCKGDKVNYLRSIGARIGDNCELITSIKNFGSEPWLIEIGNHVTLSDGVWLVTHDASSRLFRDNHSDMNSFGNKFGSIVIGNNCFVGVNSIIMPNVCIGDNSIVGAGSLVTGSVSPNSVIAGSPARFMYTLDEYISHYRTKMIPLIAKNREELRKELTIKLWGAER